MNKKNISKSLFFFSVFVLLWLFTKDNNPFFLFPFFFLWAEEHLYITKAAIEVLPKKEREFLEPEKDLLWKIYCMFPDLNGAHYGKFGGEGGFPDLPRTPDIRREWDISYYCGFDPITGNVPEYTPGMITTTMFCPPFFKKEMYHENLGYCPMGSYEAPSRYFPKVIDCWQNGLFADGMRFLGVLLHHIEDRGAFAYWPELHIKGHISNPEKVIKLDSYNPKILGDTIEKAVVGIEKRMRELCLFTEKSVSEVAKFIQQRKQSQVEKLILKNALENVKVVADVIHTAIFLVDCNKSIPYWRDYRDLPKGINLLQNPSFEIDDGTGVPAGWVVRYYNLEDRIGRAEWVNSKLYSIWYRVVRSGKYSVKLMWSPEEGIEWRQRWTCAIPVKKGQKFEYSGWIKTEKATGKNYLIVYFYTRDNTIIESVRSKSVKGTNTWQKISFAFEVPEKAEKIIVACRSDGNKGAVWFDDMEIIKL